MERLLGKFHANLYHPCLAATQHIGFQLSKHRCSRQCPGTHQHLREAHVLHSSSADRQGVCGQPVKVTTRPHLIAQGSVIQLQLQHQRAGQMAVCRPAHTPAQGYGAAWRAVDQQQERMLA